MPVSQNASWPKCLYSKMPVGQMLFGIKTRNPFPPLSLCFFCHINKKFSTPQNGQDSCKFSTALLYSGKASVPPKISDCLVSDWNSSSKNVKDCGSDTMLIEIVTKLRLFENLEIKKSLKSFSKWMNEKKG